jgi:uncharacterized membrane protein YdbT with pleckstrin-like domain
MYSGLKGVLLQVLRVPEKPEPPRGEELEVFLASPRWFNYRRILWALQSMALAAFLAPFALGFIGVGQGEPTKSVVLVSIVALVGGLIVVQRLFVYLTLRIDYEMRWYMVTDRSLRIREGVIGLREMTLTFANIQEISITQGPVQRLFKIHDLLVRTAGGGGAPQQQGHAAAMHIGYFRGVDNAEEIRDLIRARLKAYKSTGLGDGHVEVEPESPGGGSLSDALVKLRDETRALRDAVETAE